MATKNVSLSLSENTEQSPETSIAWVSGKTVYGHIVTASTEVVQEAYVVSSLLIEGVTSYTSPNVAYNVGSAVYNFSYSNVTNIGVSGLTVASGATANTETLKLTVGFPDNETSSPRSWSVTITGNTPSGSIIEAKIIGTQNGALTHKLTLGWLDTSNTRQAGLVKISINGGAYSTDSYMTPTHTITGFSSGDVVNYIITPLSSNNYLMYSGTTTMGDSDKSVDGVAVPNSFVVKFRPYSTTDSQTNIFRLDYTSANGASGYKTIQCQSGSQGTATIVLDSNYITDSSDYFKYTVTKTAGNINITGWDMSGSHAQETNVTTTQLNNQYLNSIGICNGHAANIILSYRGTYSYYTGTVYFQANDATNWSSCNIILGSKAVLEGINAEDSGTFTATTSSQSFLCKIGGGIGDSKKYRRFFMEIEHRDGQIIWSGPCRYLYGTDGDFSGVTLTASDLNGSTWMLTDTTYAGLNMYFSPSSISGTQISSTLYVSWWGLKSNTTITVSLPEGMKYGNSSTITIPNISASGNTNYYVTVPANTGTTSGGSSKTYEAIATGTDSDGFGITGKAKLVQSYERIIKYILHPKEDPYISLELSQDSVVVEDLTITLASGTTDDDNFLNGEWVYANNAHPINLNPGTSQVVGPRTYTFVIKNYEIVQGSHIYVKFYMKLRELTGAGVPQVGHIKISGENINGTYTNFGTYLPSQSFPYDTFDCSVDLGEITTNIYSCPTTFTIEIF